MFFSKQRLALVLAIVSVGWSSADASSSEADEMTYLRKVNRRLPSKPKGTISATTSAKVTAAKIKTKTKDSVKAAAKKKMRGMKSAAKKATGKKIDGSTKKNVSPTSLTSTSTGSRTSSKGVSKGVSKGKNGSMKNRKSFSDPEPQNLFVPSLTMPPVKLRPDMDDWMGGCPTESTAIDGCVTLVTTASNPTNCKMCLKGLASFNNPPPPSDNGVRLCAEGPTCGMCTVDDVRPFYACGLQVDGAFVVEGRLDGNSTNTTTNATAAPVVTQPPLNVDGYNCPALWPGDGIACVMLDGFDAKRCVYPEYGLDSICECFSIASLAHPTPLTWKCMNGPVSLVVESGDTSTTRSGD